MGYARAVPVDIRQLSLTDFSEQKCGVIRKVANVRFWLIAAVKPRCDLRPQLSGKWTSNARS